MIYAEVDWLCGQKGFVEYGKSLIQEKSKEGCMMIEIRPIGSMCKASSDIHSMRNSALILHKG